MSGFVAILETTGAPVDARLVRTMLDVAPFDAAHTAVQTRRGVALGSTPLRTPHRHERQQPLCHAGLTCVMDGRLDARAELVRCLEDGLGRRFFDASDVELVLAAYQRWGTGCPSHLLGDFSFCVWDEQRQQLFSARDHLGVKPLFYAWRGEALVISNVLHSIRRHPAVSTRLDDYAIGDVLLVGACMHQSRTSFADIARVPPAHALTCAMSSSSPTVERYWSLQPGDELRLRDPREYVERYLGVLETVVGDRLRDEPAGVLMSGGLDSSSVAAAAVTLRGPDALRAYTFVYDSAAEDDERRYSSLVARRLGIQIDHHPVDGYGWFERWNAGLLPPEPSTEPMTAMTCDLLERVAQRSAVALTGDGGDPAFVPSTMMHLLGLRPFRDIVMGACLTAWRTRTQPPIGIRAALRQWLSPERKSLVPPWLADSFVRRCDLHDRSEVLGRRRLPAEGPRGPAAGALTDPWWTSMFETYDPGATQRAVDLRYPLFDVRFITFVLSLPSNPWCLNKELVRSAMRGRLPDEICVRPKTPLAVDVVRAHGRLTVGEIATAIASAPELASYIDLDAFTAAVCEDDVMTDREPAAWSALALATWLRCDAGAAVPA
jgi:asparagine synthase (glutamine-hydrolysing)